MNLEGDRKNFQKQLKSENTKELSFQAAQNTPENTKEIAFSQKTHPPPLEGGEKVVCTNFRVRRIRL